MHTGWAPLRVCYIPLPGPEFLCLLPAKAVALSCLQALVWAFRLGMTYNLLENLKSNTNWCRLHRGLCLPADQAVVMGVIGHRWGCFQKPLQPASLLCGSLCIICGSGKCCVCQQAQHPAGHDTDFTPLFILGCTGLSAPRTGCPEGRAEAESSSWSPHSLALVSMEKEAP